MRSRLRQGHQGMGIGEHLVQAVGQARVVASENGGSGVHDRVRETVQEFPSFTLRPILVLGKHPSIPCMRAAPRSTRESIPMLFPELRAPLPQLRPPVLGSTGKVSYHVGKGHKAIKLASGQRFVRYQP